MKLSPSQGGLVGLCIAMFGDVVLLTPLSGLETRNPALVHPADVATLILIFVAAVLNAVALVLLRRRERASAILAGLGLFLVLPAVTLDQIGQFSALPPPTAIRVLEYAIVTIEAMLLVTAFLLWSESSRDGPPKSEWGRSADGSSGKQTHPLPRSELDAWT